MTANNPFEESSNPWSSEAASGPRFGNAYEDSGQNNNSWRMPSPSDYRHESNKIETTHNESTKVEFNPQVHEQDTSTAWEAPASSRQTPDSNAYQFSGTRYGNVDHHSGNAYSAAPVAATPPPLPETPRPSNKSNKDDNGLPPAWDDKRMHPSKWRALLRFIQLIASIGHLGFAAGASPVSPSPSFF
ncbi:hypothetical protein DM01DRAFT_1234472 [Hesseltinella vesiculosa]|uniref:Uncharacterized protein n=1 Tax=Hesseltinella vesiculosa TaxID=101127 RepID=A0A1X2GLG2_9FUNG|nr:hypothetical protein DM01DRAFT_1234472 [Hesseltinella vesiculosa]